MAQYTGFQAILNAALGRYYSAGFRLVELSDHILVLFYKDEPVGAFSQDGATIPAIHRACCEHLQERGF